MTPNQLVARNLRRAREELGWNQARAAEELAERGGLRWSKATLSAAETAANRSDGRAFSADELVAFARTFDLPVTWFLLPQEDESPESVEIPGARDMPVSELMRRLFRLDETEERVRACFGFAEEWSFELARRLIADSLILQMKQAADKQRRSITESIDDVTGLLDAIRQASSGTAPGSLLEAMEGHAERAAARREPEEDEDS